MPAGCIVGAAHRLWCCLLPSLPCCWLLVQGGVLSRLKPGPGPQAALAPPPARALQVFANDVYLCATDVIRLLQHDADIVCGMVSLPACDDAALLRAVTSKAGLPGPGRRGDSWAAAALRDCKSLLCAGLLCRTLRRAAATLQRSSHPGGWEQWALCQRRLHSRHSSADGTGARPSPPSCEMPPAPLEWAAYSNSSSARQLPGSSAHTSSCMLRTVW